MFKNFFKKFLYTFLISNLLISPVFAKTDWYQKPPLGSQINWSHPLSQGLVGCWLINEGGGKKTIELVNGKLGSILDKCSWGTKKALGLKFDGTDSYVSTLWGSKIVTELTVFVYYNPTAYDANNNILFTDSSDAVNIHAAYTGAGVYFYVRSSAAGDGVLGGTLTLGQDHQVVGTYTTNGQNNRKLYVDGKYIGQGQNYSGTVSLGTNAYFGCHKNGPTIHPFNGLIYMVAFWKRKLRLSEIQSLYVSPYQFIKMPSLYNLYTPAIIPPTVTFGGQVIWIN